MSFIEFKLASKIKVNTQMDKINVKRTLKLVDKKEVKLSNQRKQKTKSSKHKNKAQYKTKQSKPRTNKTKPKK